MCHQQLHQMHLWASAQTAEGRGAAGPATPQPPQHPAHLSPVGGGVQRLPAVAVLGTQAGLVLQEQGSGLAEPAGSCDVQLQTAPP